MADTQTIHQPSIAEQSNKIAHVIGIMSGKGGVGKSLVTGLLACALKKAGYEVGILDADVTAPAFRRFSVLRKRLIRANWGYSRLKRAQG